MHHHSHSCSVCMLFLFFASAECFIGNQARRFAFTSSSFLAFASITQQWRLIRLGARLKVKLLLVFFFSPLLDFISITSEMIFFARSNCCPITVNISLFFVSAFLLCVSCSILILPQRRKKKSRGKISETYHCTTTERNLWWKEGRRSSSASLSLHRYGNHELYNEW